MDHRIIIAVVALLTLGGFFADWAFRGAETNNTATRQAVNGPMRGIDDVDETKAAKKPGKKVERPVTSFESHSDNAYGD